MKDKAVHAEVLEGMLSFIREHTRFRVAGLTYSPIRGPEGNIEFLCHLTHEERAGIFEINDIVNSAHEELGR